MVTFNQLGLRSLSKDGVQSRTMNTSFANLCLFLNDFGTFNYFSLPMVNHHFLDPILPNSVMKNKIVHDRICSSVVIVFYKFGSGVDSDPLYDCLSQERITSKGKCKFLRMCTIILIFQS